MNSTEASKDVSEGTAVYTRPSWITRKTARVNVPLVSLLALILSFAAMIESTYVLISRGKSSKARTRAMTIFARADSARMARLDSVEKRLKNVELDLLLLKLGNKPTVDLAATSLQDIGEGFSVGGLQIEEQLTGIKITGRVINRESVDHEMAQFKVRIGSSMNTFTVNRLPSGRSASFEVYVPDVTIESSRYASIAYEQSTVQFGR